MTCTAGITDWNTTELPDLDRIIRKNMHVFGAVQPRADGVQIF